MVTSCLLHSYMPTDLLLRPPVLPTLGTLPMFRLSFLLLLLLRHTEHTFTVAATRRMPQKSEKIKGVYNVG